VLGEGDLPIMIVITHDNSQLAVDDLPDLDSDARWQTRKARESGERARDNRYRSCFGSKRVSFGAVNPDL
jgi:hypothetical protein